MSEAKDPGIKLFGKTIQLPDIPVGSRDTSGASVSSSGASANDDTDQNHASAISSAAVVCHTNRDGEEEEDQEIDKDALEEKPANNSKEGVPTTISFEESINQDANSRTGENSDVPSTEKGGSTSKTSKTDEEQSETSNTQQKTLKKPDKILPCPRCNSMDTKFCYYNNYNVNQPRHFCKNCQRYWTAGGTMRNVPVGAGRRKNKSSSSNCRQLVIPEPLRKARMDLPNGVHHPSVKSNGTVLTFSTDSSLCESMASTLNLADKTMQNYARSGFHKPEQLGMPVSYSIGEKRDDQSRMSFVSSSSSKDEESNTRPQEQVMQNHQGFQPQISCFPGEPWSFPWNPAQWSSPILPPALYPPGFTTPFYPAAAYWGCALSGTWNNPWVAQPLSPINARPSSGPNSPTLGKHSREENMLKPSISGDEDSHLKENNKEKCIWVPKTLRIDDPGGAAKTSLWKTLGIKNDKTDSVGGGGLFKAFESKGDEKNHQLETLPVLQANPAALSRSVNFHERS